MPLPSTKAVLVSARAQASASTLVADLESSFIEEARNSVITAIDDGLTLSDWMDSFQAIADRYGIGEDATYAEMVFRTVGQSAYQGGKFSDMMSEEGQARAGYWQYSGVNDDRQDDECSELDGQIFDKTDLDAQGYWPPVHFNCRCSVIELDSSEIEGQTISTGNTTDINIDFDNELLVIR